MNVSYLVLLKFFKKKKEMPIYSTEEKIRSISIFLIFQPPQLVNKIHGTLCFSFCWINGIYAMKTNSTKFSIFRFSQASNQQSVFQNFVSHTLRFPKKCGHLITQSATNLCCLVKMKISWRSHILKCKSALNWKKI